MKKLGLFFLASLTCQSAFADFALNNRSEVSVNKELIKTCDTAVLTTESCVIESVAYSTSFFVPAEYSIGSNTKVEIEGTFQNVKGKFAVRIRGTDYPLTSESKQSFVIPAGSTGNLDVQIVGVKPGRARIGIPHLSIIKTVAISLDGTNYIQNLITLLDSDVKAIQKAQGDYKNAKKYLEWFGKDHDKICELKEELTGRECADMSNDCLINGNKESDVLSPDSCQKLQIFNRILSGASSNETQKEKDDAFTYLSNLVTKYAGNVQTIIDAGLAVDQKYIQSRQLFQDFIKAEKPKDEITPEH